MDIGLQKTDGSGRTAWSGTEGNAHVRPVSGTGRVSHNRELDTVNKPAAEVPTASDLHTATWSAGDNIRSVTVTVVPGNTTAVVDSDGIWICFGANSDAQAQFFLSPQTAGADSAFDTYRYFIKVGESMSFDFTSALLRADCVANINSNGTANDFDVVLGAS